MKIAEIREAVDRLNWARQHHTGGTSLENRRLDLPAVLAPHIARVSALEIKPRFAGDIARQKNALESAERALASWRYWRPLVEAA